MPWSSLFGKPLVKISILIFLTAGIYQPSAITNNRESDAVPMFAMTQRVSETNLRVMTFNIRHAKGVDNKVQLDRIIEVIRQANPDIVGLQEVDRYNIRSGFKDQMNELGKALGMSWTFSPSLNFGLTQYGNALLSKYPIQASEVTVLPSDGETRTLLQAEIHVGSQMVEFYNTHLGVTLEDRERQVPILVQKLEEATIPTILMGDFNMEIDHSLMAGIRNQFYKIEVHQPTVLSGLEIDHIFVNMNVNVINAWTIPTPSSDHDPVVAEIQWGGNLVMQ
jgi:endonuclease/exonuclease/phosphatase family metal-dependent hydrolase